MFSIPFLSRLARVQPLLAAGFLAVVPLGCDDPVPGPIGGLVFIIRTFPAPAGTEFAIIDRIELEFDIVEAIVGGDITAGDGNRVVLATQRRTVELRNENRDLVVAQFQVPVGFVSQLRINPLAVRLHLQGGDVIDLPVDSSALPSWSQTGWKVVPDDGTPFPIQQDALTGVRGLFRFDERMVAPRSAHGPGFKMKPTLPAEFFVVNPLPDEPGVFFDQVTVAFHEGVQLGRVLEINAEIGATLLSIPTIGTWYRVKLPASVDLQRAFQFYGAKTEVLAVLPAVNFGQMRVDANDDDLISDSLDVTRMRDAWQVVQDSIGFVGSHSTRVGVIDDGVDVTHPDLRRNIAINQGELPQGLFDTDGDGSISTTELAAFDCEPAGGDGVITIRDLECAPAGSPVIPIDANANGLVDAFDIASDPNWADGVDSDDFDGDLNTFVDDLVGWNFAGNNRMPVTGEHGPQVASVIGAEGDNADGIAGVSWRVSIIPLVASPGFNFVPDVHFQEAIRYAEANRLDVVNISQGWHFASEDADPNCGDPKADLQTTPAIPSDQFSEGFTQANAAYRALFDPANSTTLYVLAAGNSSYPPTRFSDGILMMPQNPMLSEVRPRTLLVGASTRGGLHATDFSNIPIFTDGVFAAGVWEVLLQAGGGITPSGSRPVKGTSFASPAVAGAASLLLAVNPRFRDDAAALKQAILEAAPVSAFAPCGDGTLAGRLLNAEALVSTP